jgi:hypothetical protein
MKQSKQNCVGRKFPLVKQKMIWLSSLLMERKFFGLTITDIVCLSYQLAVGNRIKTQFCKRNEKAGRKWLKHFLCHHPEISVKTPEGLSLSRVKGFTPESVAQFFKSMNLLWTPLNIILQDFTTAMKLASLWYMKILGLKGKCQISSLQPTEWGSVVTVVTCMSPTGHFITPLLVFP